MRRLYWVFFFCITAITVLLAATKIRQAQIVSSTLDSSPVGATSPSTGAFTTLSASTSVSSPNYTDTSGTHAATSGSVRCSTSGGASACVVQRSPDNSADVQLGYASSATQVVLGSNSSGVDSGITAEVGKLQVDTGLANGVGDQWASGSSCTTAASANAACSTTVSLAATEPDVNYHINCSPVTINSGGTVIITGTGTRTTSSFVLQIQNTGANTAASQITYDCRIWHQ